MHWISCYCDSFVLNRGLAGASCWVKNNLASAMIDLSDGLSSDINHLCEESAVGALIESALFPIDKYVTELCGRRALDPLQLALHGGEDFELLFTVSPE